MEIDQLVKRVQWVEDERRKEKDAVGILDNRLTALEGSIASLNQQIKSLSGEITRLATVVTRMDQYDENVLQQRQETKRALEDMDKETKKREEETEKVRRVEIKALDSNFVDIRTALEVLPKLEKTILARNEEEGRLRRLIDENREKIAEARRDDEEYNRTLRLIEDGRRQDSKRIVELQGEVAAIRKRVDDQRGQSELFSTGLRKNETRLNELAAVEEERREAMVSFMDKQNLVQVERDRVWKDWQARFDTVEKQATDIEGRLVTIDATQREVKRASGDVDELSQRVERRISEITEIQRLSEDRFRQEWVTFKADDQKRWTNFTLTQEEQRGEVGRQFEKINERVTHLEDSLQETQDLVQQANEQSEKRLQSLLALAHEWLTTYERTMGRSR